MFQLELFGGARIVGPAGPLVGRITQRRQLALLAFLALQDRPTTRDRLLCVFWPDADTERARRALSDVVYVIRKALGEDALLSVGDDVVLDPHRVRSDVLAFRAAIAAGDFESAVELYVGPLLDGFYLSQAPAFEAWLQAERDRLAQACSSTAEALATQREQALDHAGAVAAWRRAAALEPHNSRIGLRLAKALASSGDHAGALRFTAMHTRLLEEEYGIAPSDEFVAWIAELSSAEAAPARPPIPHQQTHGDTASPEQPAVDAAAPAASGATSAASQLRRGRKRLYPGRTSAFVSLMLILLVVAFALRSAGGPTAAMQTLDPDLVVVLPFRAAGLHHDLVYLREGMVDLIAAKLTGKDGGLRVAPPGRVSSGQYYASRRSTDDLSQDAAIAIAREFGAGLLLYGSLVGVRENLSIQSMLIDVQAGLVTTQVQVRGTEGQLHSLVDRLVGEILSRTANEEEHRLAHLTSASLPALRVFLEARAAHRRGDYEAALRQYGLALDLDSAFALAGLGALAVSGWVGGSAPVSQRGAAVASANEDKLSERDRVGRNGRLPGEREGPVTTRLRIREIDDALRRYPDHARLWYMRGDEYLHRAHAIGVEDWADRARDSFEQALKHDADYAEPVHHLATVLAITRDTAALRELTVNQLARVSVGPVADYLKWLARHTIGEPFREPPPDSLHTDATLRWIGIVAQDYGFALDEGAAAVQLRLDRPGIRDEYLERRMGALAYALNAGRPDDATRILHTLVDVQPDSQFHYRIAVLSALFADGDSATAAAAGRALTANATGPTRELNACIGTLWQLREEPSRVPRPLILSDEQAVSADSGVFAVPRRVCSLVRDAQWLAREGGAAWHMAIRRLDRFLGLGPIPSLVDDGHAEYVHLALARLHVEAGDPRAALNALRRRMRYSGWQPYLAALLREEGHLAAALGADDAARRAYSHYLAFRTDPEPALQPEVDRVRTALRRLSPSPAATR